jgi:DNA repair exonuclease SbcCD ATPase subunit
LGKFEGIMLNEQQIQQILADNEGLELLRPQAAESAALRSQLDLRLEELVSMQEQIGKQQRKAAGAEQREMEMQDELADSVHLLHRQQDLKKQYIYANTQLEDLQEELANLKNKHTALQTTAAHATELESMVENLVFERDILLEKLTALETERQ